VGFWGLFAKWILSSHIPQLLLTGSLKTPADYIPVNSNARGVKILACPYDQPQFMQAQKKSGRCGKSCDKKKLFSG
jgi:hypothetical protein